MEILASRSCSAKEYWENICDLELCCSVACGHCLLADAQEMVCAGQKVANIVVEYSAVEIT